jgi:hypothetical protein
MTAQSNERLCPVRELVQYLELEGHRKFTGPDEPLRMWFDTSRGSWNGIYEEKKEEINYSACDWYKLLMES